MGNQQTNGHKEGKLENQEHEKAGLRSLGAAEENEENQAVESAGGTEEPDHLQNQPPDRKEHDTHSTSEDAKAVKSHLEEKPHSEKDTPVVGEKEHVHVVSHVHHDSEDKQEPEDGKGMRVKENELENEETEHKLISDHDNLLADEGHASHSQTTLHGTVKATSAQVAGTEEGKDSSEFHGVSVEEKTKLDSGDIEKSRDPSESLLMDDEKMHLLNPQQKDTEKVLNELPDEEGKQDGSRVKEKHKPKQPPLFGGLCCVGVPKVRSDS